ncbi:hypothetical protein Ade02nite_94350 [Paractinoplanes deccanensis]|uniref:Inositolphosphotransferase Aur1/Ipt1 domain-containing protein n=1 Tax=Paractinoplanes deccanensis TaxID=113561 RepID=A0ABQ3YLB3_9ACTN|nr:hypothetical protein Ade02nite_94350 [Actinoplanes deccanensis]
MNRVAARRAARELLLVAVLFLAYKMGRILVEGHVEEAMRNAASVWDFERALHLPSEESLQSALLSHTFWVRAANCFYAYVHFPATAITLIWMYVKRPEIYLWMRRTLATLTAFALVVHALYPLAPPRMLTSAGMADTGRLFGPSVYGSPSTDTLSNQYAAMPSLHVGWAVVVALALVAASAGRRGRWLWLAHPVLTLLVVVVTGNHYWVDAIAVTALLAVVLTLVPRPVVAPPALAPAPVPAALEAPPLPAPVPAFHLRKVPAQRTAEPDSESNTSLPST